MRAVELRRKRQCLLTAPSDLQGPRYKALAAAFSNVFGYVEGLVYARK